MRKGSKMVHPVKMTIVVGEPIVPARPPPRAAACRARRSASSPPSWPSGSRSCSTRPSAWPAAQPGASGAIAGRPRRRSTGVLIRVAVRGDVGIEGRRLGAHGVVHQPTDLGRVEIGGRRRPPGAAPGSGRRPRRTPSARRPARARLSSSASGVRSTRGRTGPALVLHPRLVAVAQLDAGALMQQHGEAVDGLVQGEGMDQVGPHAPEAVAARRSGCPGGRVTTVRSSSGTSSTMTRADPSSARSAWSWASSSAHRARQRSGSSSHCVTRGSSSAYSRAQLSVVAAGEHGCVERGAVGVGAGGDGHGQRGPRRPRGERRSRRPGPPRPPARPGRAAPSGRTRAYTLISPSWSKWLLVTSSAVPVA